MPPIDDWVNANLPADDRRLTRVYLNFFSAVPEATVVATLNALSGGFGHGPRPRHPVLDWMPVISQLQKTQFNGATAHTVLQFMTSGAGALTGSQLLTFWFTALAGRGGSEVLLDCIEHLRGGLTTPTQIWDCIVSFIDGAHRIALSKEDLRAALQHLATGGLTPELRFTFCTYLQTNYPAGVVAAAVAGTRFLALCRGMRTAAIPPATFNAFLTVHPPLTDGEFARLLMDLGYRKFREIIDAALPAGLNVPTGPPHTPAGMLGYAVTRQHTAAVSEALSEAIDAEMIPAATDFLFRLCDHLQHMAAGDRVQRVGKFIKEAKAARTSKGREHPWSEIERLLRNFTDDGRHNNAAVPPAAAVTTNARIRCTGERIQYFMRAHSYAYHDFTIAGRTREDITFFALGTTVADVRGWVGTALTNVDDEDVDTAAEGGPARIIVVGTYELGLIADGGGGGRAALIHFMPYSVDPARHWSSALLRAFRHLY